MLDFVWAEWSRKFAGLGIQQSRSHRRRAGNRLPVFEQLEDRCLLSGHPGNSDHHKQLPPGTIGVSLVQGPEGGNVEGSQVPYTLHLSAASLVDVTVTVALGGVGHGGKESATIPADATLNGAAQQVVTIPAGTIDQVFNVTLVDDTEAEKPEGYTVSILSATGATAVGKTSTKGLILDNDQPPRVSIAAVTNVTEGNSGTTPAQIVVSLDHAINTDVVITFSTDTPKSNNGKGNGNGNGKGHDNPKGKGGDKHNRADSQDFTPVKNGTVTILAGQTSAKISIDILGDTTVEPDEHFTVKLQSVTSKNAKIDKDAAAGDVVIVNDDTAPAPVTPS